VVVDAGRPSPLTAALAQEIASETSAIINFNVLVTDRRGVVIGSGATDRIGSTHEASLDVLRTRRAAWHSAEQARNMRGVRPGLTLPIMFDDDVIGTVGITGSPRQVRRFGVLVQRHTEILVRESILLRSRLQRERAVDELVRDIAFFDPDVVDAAVLQARAAELGLDLTLPRVGVLIDLAMTAGGPLSPGAPSSTRHVRTVREAFHDPQDIIAKVSNGRIAVLHQVTETFRAGEAEQVVRQRCEGLAAVLGQRDGLRVRVGLSDPAAGVVALHEAYRDAATALRVAPASAQGTQIRSISALRVRQVLATANRHTRTRFTDVVLRGLREEADWPALRETILAWAESGFNLVRAAASLHIHRNTLIYRLDKIAERSGQRIRDPGTALTLYVACLTEQVTVTPAETEPS
jgi:carbohydrate diacid regulator